MLSQLSFLLPCTLLLLITPSLSSPAPSSASSQGISLPLKRLKRSGPLSDEWYGGHKGFLEAKYQVLNGPSPRKRQNSGTSYLTNWQADTSYFATVSIGTPSVDYDIVLDTGSSDFWLVSSACLPGCSSAQLAYYSPGASSTFSDANSQPFGIAYFGGSVNGTTASETVKLAGITIQNQAYGIINHYDQNSGVLPRGVSGLMGLAWDPLAKLGLPFWENSAKAVPSWPEPLFTFALSRENNNPNAQAFAPGGMFTVGFKNSAVYTGEVDYIALVDETWWLIPVTEITIDGSSMELSGQYAAIDTGTTLIGGPQVEVEQLYASITDSQVQVGIGASAGYYFLSCSAQVQLSFSFGGKTWAMDPSDFLTETGTEGICRGALFAGNFGSPGTATPTWIIGDAFLKNVYSVFRWNPPSVGFATLSNPSALSTNQTAVVTASVSAASSTDAVLTPGPQSTGVVSSTGVAAHTTYSWYATGSSSAASPSTLLGRVWWIAAGLLVTMVSI